MKIIGASPFEIFSVAAGSGCGGNPNDFPAHVNDFRRCFLMNFRHSLAKPLGMGKMNSKKISSPENPVLFCSYFQNNGAFCEIL